ncbi:MAG TPA: phosphate ABC transporter substrate-binding protein PstS [Fimbriimonadaceae bacterium]|nr:phosphate ABC transporter substrate-binding protein PstS [Fimbriimonadaceae bacterium]
MKPCLLLTPLAILAAVGLAGCGSGGSSSNTPNSANGGSPSGTTLALTGAGSTFVNPAMSHWVDQYQRDNPGVTINYQAVGSGAGISQLEAGTVDFAASDVAMSDDELKTMPGPVVQIPMISGCVAMAYNLPGIQSGLKLSGDVIADIYLGKITKWNDPRIVQQNPGVNLPDLAIAVVHRSDASGTSYIFTDYLCNVSAAWKSGPGKGKTVSWPTGVGEPHNDGVAGYIKQSTGGFGYVELAYVIQTNMTCATVKNRSGNYIQPTIDSTSVAVNAAVDSLKKDIRASIVDTSAPQGYPIAGFTYAIVDKTPKDPNKAKASIDFLKWVLGPGQEMASKLQYAPLPKALADLNDTALTQVQTK